MPTPNRIQKNQFGMIADPTLLKNVLEDTVEKNPT